MAVSRRDFVRGLALFGAAGLARADEPLFTAAPADFDASLCVFLSDVHVGGEENSPKYPCDKLRDAVAEILKMRPLPSNVVVFGDLAWLHGMGCDYDVSKPFLKMLTDAGITLTIGMGNHDRRGNFAERYPDTVKTSLVEGLQVHLAVTPHADLLMLDTLQGKDGEYSGPVPGALPENEQEWLTTYLKAQKKPLFVASHHPLHELKIGNKKLAEILAKNRAVAGYIHGHDHRWRREWSHPDWSTVTTLRTLCLPSTGLWGDIGYTVFRVAPDRAVAELRQNDFYFPCPLPKERRPAQWDEQLAENRASPVCTFRFRGKEYFEKRPPADK